MYCSLKITCIHRFPLVLNFQSIWRHWNVLYYLALRTHVLGQNIDLSMGLPFWFFMSMSVPHQRWQHWPGLLLLSSCCFCCHIIIWLIALVAELSTPLSIHGLLQFLETPNCFCEHKCCFKICLSMSFHDFSTYFDLQPT